MAGAFDDLIPASAAPAFADLIPGARRGTVTVGPFTPVEPVGVPERSWAELGQDQFTQLRTGLAEALPPLLDAPRRTINALTDAFLTPAGSPNQPGLPDANRFAQAREAVRIEQPEDQQQWEAETTARIAAYRAANLSDTAQAQYEGIKQADGALDVLKFVYDNPGFIATELPKVLGNMATALAGGAALRGVGLVRGQAATGATLSLQGATFGGMTADQVEAALLSAPPEVTAPLIADVREKMPFLAEALDADILKVLSDRRATDAFKWSAAVNAALPLAIPGGATVERFVAGVPTRTGSRLAGATAGMLGEGVTEGVQGGLDQVIQNVYSEQPAGEGVGKASVLEALIGGGMGAVAGGLSAQANPAQARVRASEGTPQDGTIDPALLRAGNEALSQPQTAPPGEAEPSLDELLVANLPEIVDALPPETLQAAMTALGIDSAPAATTPAPLPARADPPGQTSDDFVRQVAARMRVSAQEQAARAQVQAGPYTTQTEEFKLNKSPVSAQVAATDTETRRNVGTPAMFASGKNVQAVRMADGSYRIRRRQAGQWQAWEQAPASFAPTPGLFRPFVPQLGTVTIDGQKITVGDRQPVREKAEKRPRTLLDTIGPLNREAWQAEGVDPAQLAMRRGFNYVFSKKGGLTPDGARELMQQEGFLPQDDPSLPPTVDDNDAIDLVMRALMGEEIYSEGDAGAAAQADSARREEQEASQTEWEAQLADQHPDVADEDYDDADRLAAVAQRARAAGVDEFDIAPFSDEADTDYIARLEAEITQQEARRGTDNGSNEADRGERVRRDAGAESETTGVAEERPGFALEAKPAEARQEVAPAFALEQQTKTDEIVDDEARRKMAARQTGLFGGRELVDAVEQQREAQARSAPPVGGGLFSGQVETGELPAQDVSGYGNTRPLSSGPERGRVASADRDATGRLPQLDLFIATRGQAQPGTGHPPAVKVNRPKLLQSARLVETGQFRSGIERVTSLADAAHILAPLRKSAQEQFLILAMDADGKPIAVLRHTIGLATSAEIDPGTVLGAVAAIPGVRRVVFGHNHPSGNPKPSGGSGDIGLESRLGKLFDGTGIEVAGSIILQPGRKTFTAYGASSTFIADPISDITAARRNKVAVPQVERQLRRVQPIEGRGKVADPEQAKQAVRKLVSEGYDSGVILLNAQQERVGVIPMTHGDMLPLKTSDVNSGMADLMRRATEANAYAAVIFGGQHAQSYMQNVAGALKSGGVRALDIFTLSQDGQIESLAGQGRDIGRSGIYESIDDPSLDLLPPDGLPGVADPDAAQERSQQQGEADADRLGLRDAVDKALGPAAQRVTYLRGQDALPKRLRNDLAGKLEQRGGRGRTSALYDPDTKQVYLFTDVIQTPEQAVWNALHEIAGHHGLREFLGDKLNHALEIALQNPTVAALADAITRQRKLRPDQHLRAAEEALAELAAALRTGNWDAITSRYGVDVPTGIRERVKAAVENFIKRLKALLGKQGIVFKDADVRALLEAAWQAVDGNAAIGEPGALEAVERPQSFAEQVRTRLQSGNQRGSMLDMGRTPAVLRMLGFPVLPMRMPSSVLFKLATGKDGERAPLTERQIARLPELMDEPQAILKSSTSGDSSVVVVTDARDSEGNQVVVSVVQGRADAGNPVLRVNVLTSAYGKNDLNWFKREGAAGRGLYADQEKALGRLVGSGAALHSSTEQGGQGPKSILRGPNDLRNYRAEQRNKVLDDSDSGLESVEYTPAQEEFLRKAGLPVDRRSRLQKIGDGLRSEWDKLAAAVTDGDAFRAAAVDGLHGLRAAEARLGLENPETSSYIAARMTRGLASVMEALLSFGAPKWDGGVLGIDANTKGLLDALKPVEGHIDEWLGWMVARRARVLKAQGREHLMSDADIAAGLSLAAGREQAFEQAGKDYLKIKKAVLDVAQEAGLIDPAARAAWDHAEYIPFYREENEQSIGPGTRRALSGQTSGIRTLKGGEQALSDPLANIIRNFTRLIDASGKNRAVLLAVDQLGDAYFKPAASEVKPALIPMDQVKRQLQAQGVSENIIAGMPPAALQGVQQMLSIVPPTGENVVRVMRGGKPEYYESLDPLVTRALTNFKVIERRGVMRPLIFFRRLLTTGVTTTADFIGANFLRDTGSAWVISDDRFKPGWDSVKGVINSLRNDKAAQELMMAGGTFMGGNYYGGDPDMAAAAMRRALRQKGMSNADIEGFVSTVARTPLHLWDAYMRLSSAVENANRRAVYDAALKAGRSKVEAAYMARDLMDFSMRGDSAMINFFADVLPFFNARLQGMYKLGRRAGTPKGRRAVVLRGGVMMMGSVALYAWNIAMHGDAYDELEEWDKDAYWHIAPGTEYHTRIPKPFEIGLAFGTVPERMLEAIRYANTGDGDTPNATWDALKRAIGGTLAVNPIPQAALPLVEDWSNKRFFTGRPIENMGDENLLPEARAEWWTSDTMQEISKMLPQRGKLAISPKRLEHLWTGYTAGMGGYVLDASDWVVRQLVDTPERPDMALREFPVAGRFLRGDTPAGSKYVGQFYDLLDKAKTIEQTIKEYTVTGRADEADALALQHADLLGERYESRGKGGFGYDNVKRLRGVQSELAALRAEIEKVAMSEALSGHAKREQIDALTLRRNKLVRTAVTGKEVAAGDAGVDIQYRTAVQGLAEVQETAKDRLVAKPMSQWEAEFEKIKAEHPAALAGVTLDIYVQGSRDGQYGPGDPNPDSKGRPHFIVEKGDSGGSALGEIEGYPYWSSAGGRAKHYDGDGVEDRIKRLDEAIELVRDSHDITRDTLLEITDPMQLSLQSAIDLYDSVSANRNGTAQANQRVRERVLNDLMALRQAEKRAAVEIIERAENGKPITRGVARALVQRAMDARSDAK